MSVKVQIKIDQASLDQAREKALGIAAQRVMKGFDTVVGPHLLRVAKARAPVGKRETKNPQRSSFHRADLAPLDDFPKGEARSKLTDLQGFSRPELLASSYGRFIRRAGSEGVRDPEVTRFFRVDGKQPNVVRIQNNTIKGAVIHKPGTLRDSHVYVPARKVRPDKVIAEVRATADYAAAQHEGFNHYSHGKKTGRQVKGQPWMPGALTNVKGDLTSSKTYEG